jgi:hypothetical protein
MRLDAAQCIVLIGCVFMGIVTELKTYRIYKAVLLTMKVATRNLSGQLNFHRIIQQILDIGLLLHERV